MTPPGLGDAPPSPLSAYDAFAALGDVPSPPSPAYDADAWERRRSHPGLPPPVVWKTQAEAEDEMNQYLNRDSSSNSSEQPVQPSAGEQPPPAAPPPAAPPAATTGGLPPPAAPQAAVEVEVMHHSLQLPPPAEPQAPVAVVTPADEGDREEERAPGEGEDEDTGEHKEMGNGDGSVGSEEQSGKRPRLE